MTQHLKPLEAQILEAEQEFYENNVVEPTHIIMRPEMRVHLMEELGLGWEDHLTSYLGLTVCICDSPTFPPFKLGTW